MAGFLNMTLANGIGQLESARLLLRRIAPDDLPFFARLHALPEIAQALIAAELGYTFDPDAWGQGYATEAARCVRDYARDVLRLSYAVSAILPHNPRSRRVAEGSGAQAAGQMDIMGRTFDRYVWPLAIGGETRLQPIPSKR